MKTRVLIFLCSAALFSCSPKIGIFETINARNAHRIRSYDDNNIESKVTFYFASRIRNDQEWRKVLPDSTEWSRRMRASIEKHNRWKFIEFQNKGFHESTYGGVVDVYFVIEIDGRRDGGTDGVELKKVNDKWIISKVPI